MSLFARNLNKWGQEIQIQTRSAPAVSFGNVDPDPEFVTKHTVQAIVKTPRGKATFDDVGLDEVVTHQFVLAWLDGITAQDWVFFKGKRYDIVNDMNCCERDTSITLFCRLRGDQEASKA